MNTLISRRRLLQTLGLASAAAPVLTAADLFAQGRCMTTFGTPECNTASIPPPFKPTGWKTAAFDHVTFDLADYRAEAAFYIALVGWRLRGDDGKQAVLDMGDWGTAVFRQAAPGAFDAASASSRRGPVKALVTSFGFAIDTLNAKTVEQELATRSSPTAARTAGAAATRASITSRSASRRGTPTTSRRSSRSAG